MHNVQISSYVPEVFVFRIAAQLMNENSLHRLHQVWENAFRQGHPPIPSCPVTLVETEVEPFLVGFHVPLSDQTGELWNPTNWGVRKFGKSLEASFSNSLISLGNSLFQTWKTLWWFSFGFPFTGVQLAISISFGPAKVALFVETCEVQLLEGGIQ